MNHPNQAPHMIQKTIRKEDECARDHGLGFDPCWFSFIFALAAIMIDCGFEKPQGLPPEEQGKNAPT